MRVVIQRVQHASVTVDGTVTGRIGKGYMILVGIGESDEEEDALWLTRKIVGLRVFDDENGVMNRSIMDVGGNILVISQFTLMASYKKGNRPSYICSTTAQSPFAWILKIRNSAMTLDELQQTVDAWIKKYGVRYFSELTNMACLTEEVGEMARIMARTYGDQSFKEGEKHDLGDEIADVLWVLTCIANQTGVNLDKALKKNIEKKTKRDAERHKNNIKLRQ